MNDFKKNEHAISALGSLLLVTLLAGCARTPLQPSASVSTEPANTALTAVQEKADTTAISPLVQCKRDLESLRTVDSAQYRRYLADYDNLMKTSAGFLSVKDDVSPEVAALARPRLQFAMVNLCYRIKDALAQVFIKQAGSEK